ncbi:molecular chaperone DnaJ [Mesorhizobium sp. L-8-10]|uniref:DnaJ domain-containing protein n=1 Tax=unclassified Mesorhizobium TaxID=325217 RepID=UPI0019254098|nr:MULTISPECIES: DnaJ domain-containing protein [unclassified Mesorhizobium]BCH32691.1 molecular chaperone DnaJ [Mesorhizobium sp. L-8-10]
MTVAVYALLVLLFVVGLAAVFVRADPARLAEGLRKSGPIVLGIAGALLLVTGRAGVGGMLMSLAFGWYGYQRRNRNLRKTPGKRSTVRTAALEMELDHDSGVLEGIVLAGRFETRILGEMTLHELVELHAELAGDGESRQLLEAYLDGRFPVWRKDAEADVGRGERVAPGSGAMTKEEAYKVLGLETGASAADVRKAHRRLMQRLHPDIGGSSFLAARINEAKDVLLSDHD